MVTWRPGGVRLIGRWDIQSFHIEISGRYSMTIQSDLNYLATSYPDISVIWSLSCIVCCIFFHPFPRKFLLKNKIELIKFLFCIILIPFHINHERRQFVTNAVTMSNYISTCLNLLIFLCTLLLLYKRLCFICFIKPSAFMNQLKTSLYGKYVL